MNTQTAPVSDHARRTARRVAALLTKADALLITAGAGMSAGLRLRRTTPTWSTCRALFDAAGRTFRQMAQPVWFDNRPASRLGLVRPCASGSTDIRNRTTVTASCGPGRRPCLAAASSRRRTSTASSVKAGFTDWQVVERHGSVHRYQCTVPCSDDDLGRAGPGHGDR